MIFALPEDAVAAMAEREAEARRIAAVLAWERAVGRSGPGVAGALKLLARELLWALAGVDVPPAYGRPRPPRVVGRTAARGAR